MDNKNNILIIGNGFDLYHGLKTSYAEFVNFSNKIIKTKKGTEGRSWAISNSFIKCFLAVITENQSWIDCENEIEVIITIFKKILNNMSIFDDRNILLKSNSSLYSFEFERLKLMPNKIVKKSNISSVEFDSSNFRIYQGIDKNRIMGILKKDLENLILLFQFYLINYVMNEPVNSLSEQIKELDAEYVINFNYTNTYKNYNIKSENVCFIHGSALDNNMVLGIKDIGENDIETIYFKKYFQRIQKHTNTIDWSKFNNTTNSHFFGHSLSNTDGDIIREIYKRSYKIVVYYMPSFNDYEKKIINLIETLGKETVINGMYSGKIEFLKIR